MIYSLNSQSRIFFKTIATSLSNCAGDITGVAAQKDVQHVNRLSVAGSTPPHLLSPTPSSTITHGLSLRAQRTKPGPRKNQLRHHLNKARLSPRRYSSLISSAMTLDGSLMWQHPLLPLHQRPSLTNICLDL